MQGSSAFQFARAAYRAGLLSRRRLVADALGQHPLPAARRDRRGLARAARADRDRRCRARRVLDLRAARARRAGGDPAARLPEDAGRRARAPGRRSARLHHHRRLAGAGRHPGAGAGVRRRDRARRSVGGGRRRLHRSRQRAVRLPRGKAEAIRELAAREGIDLSASYAYSDSVSDLPMLEAVGHPVAVNPDGALGRIARERGWERDAPGSARAPGEDGRRRWGRPPGRVGSAASWWHGACVLRGA